MNAHAQPIGRVSAGVIASGSAGEAIGGAAAIVVAILGLTGIMPTLMMAVACLAVAGGLLFEGGAIASRLGRLLAHTEGRIEIAEVGGGVSAEFIAGLAGIALGVLALLGIDPMVLLPVSALLFGAALLVGSGTTLRLKSVAVLPDDTSELVRAMTNQAVVGAAGVEFLVGGAAIALSILALVGVGDPPVLTMVAFLALGAAILIGGSAIAAKLVNVFR